MDVARDANANNAKIIKDAARAPAERRHGVLAVGHLSHDGALLAAAGQVLVKRVLAEGLLSRNDVVAARVAGRAVAREQRLARLDVAGKRGKGREERAGGERRRGDLLVGLKLDRRGLLRLGREGEGRGGEESDGELHFYVPVRRPG